MPVPKRWFHCSRDLNQDPELWELTEQFGDRSLRLWLEILAHLEKSENRWRLSGEWLAGLSRTVRQQSASVRRAILWMLAKGWLTAEETAADGFPTVLSAPNYWKYRRLQERSGKLEKPNAETHRETIAHPSYPILSLPILEKREEKSIQVKSSKDVNKEAEEILAFLNLKTGRRYRAREESGKPTANLEHIVHRLQAGATSDQCRAVIAMKCREWNNQQEMKKFLRPATLFNRLKFEQYLGEVGVCNVQIV